MRRTIFIYTIYYRVLHILSYNIRAIYVRYCSINRIDMRAWIATLPPSSAAAPAAAFSAQERFVGCGRWVGRMEAPRGWFTHDSRVFMVVLVFYWSFNKLDLACQYVYVAVVGTTTSLIQRACACVRHNVIRAPCYYIHISGGYHTATGIY